MPDTGSTRMAMRWSFSERIGSWRRAALVGGVVLVTACSHRSYTPDGGAEPRLDTEETRRELATTLIGECPRLQRRGGTGEARLLLDLDSGGDVIRARISRSSGDDKVDEIFGRAATRLHFERPASSSGAIRMGYSCTSDAVVITIQVET